MNFKGKSLGILFAAISYVMWGVLPVYWKALQSVPPLLILAQRIFWSFIMLFIYICLTGKMGQVKEALHGKRDMVIVLGCSILITINWGTYIMAVNTGHIVESSMGYYINPLISILLGITVLKVKLGISKIAALVLVAIGVGYMVIQYGTVPWISLILAITFGLYGLLKKLTGFDSAVGLFFGDSHSCAFFTRIHSSCSVHKRSIFWNRAIIRSCSADMCWSCYRKPLAVVCFRNKKSGTVHHRGAAVSVTDLYAASWRICLQRKFFTGTPRQLYADLERNCGLFYLAFQET